jgi:hypothetical protein
MPSARYDSQAGAPLPMAKAIRERSSVCFSDDVLTSVA